MLGGGTFVIQNKVLPGTYINFVNSSGVSNILADRGALAVPMKLTWGADDAIFSVEWDDFKKNCLKIFGFTYYSDEAKPFREMFKNANILYVYKLMNGGAKASNSVAEALYCGSTGAKISTEIAVGTEDETWDVTIYLGTTKVVEETVSSIDELKADNNGFVSWTLEAMAVSNREYLSGETLDGDDITASQHSAFLNASEEYSFNAMICPSTEQAIKQLYVQECKDMRDNAGVKWQLVVFDHAADYEGVVNVKNCLEAIYWVGGAIAGTAINASNTNKIYDGEYAIPTKYTKSQLEASIKAGEFIFHRVGDDVRVLTDINSLVTFTDVKGIDFQSNQTIRIIDQIAMDIATVFNTYYLGIVPNDNAGRTSLWNQIVKYLQNLENMRAIQDFDSESVTITQGDTKKSVLANMNISVMNCMEQLYMTVVVA